MLSARANPLKTMLIVLLHGVGSDGASMQPVADYLRERFPRAALYAPDGPYPFDAAVDGRQWFSVSGITDENRSSRVRDAVPKLVELIDRRLARYDLAWRHAAVLGFSQGAIMALSLLEMPDIPAAIVSLSGRLATDIGPRATSSQVMLTHGAEDGVIPLECSQKAFDQLIASSVAARLHVVRRQGHAISEEQLHEACLFLRETFLSA